MQIINPIDEPVIRKALLSLGISQQLLANWRVRGVPLDRCAPIEIQSGQVVTRKILRPNDWHIHWPELVAATAPELAAAPVQMVEVVVCAGSALGYVGAGIHPAPAI